MGEKIGFIHLKRQFRHDNFGIPFFFNDFARARITIPPLPVAYTCLMSSKLKICPPVGKSGPLMNSINSSIDDSG